MKKILFVMLEIDSASGICTKNVTERMSNDGWTVEILSYPTDKTVNDNVHFIGIRPKINIWMQQVMGPNSKLGRIFAIAYKLQVAVTTFIWPWNAPFFSYKLYKLLCKLHEHRQYDVVVVVYTQIDPLIAGSYFKKLFPNVKVISYFLDSLSGGPRPKLLSEKQKIKKGIAWEKKLLKNMDAVVYMESSMHHHLKYSSKFEYFKKVFFLDVPMLKIDRLENETTQENAKNTRNTIVITYVGTLPNSIRNPEYAFKLLSEIRNINWQLNIVGEGRYKEKEFNTCGISINWLGKMPHEKALEFLKRSDVLLNIGNIVEGMVPSKIFEYISYRKAILSFAPNYKEASIPYIKKYPAGCVILESDNFLYNKEKLNNFLTNLPKCTLSDDELKKLYYKNTPECFEEFIDMLL